LTDYGKIKKLFEINETCGYSEEDLSYWVNTYGSVPKALMDYYVQFGKHKTLNNAQDFLIKPAMFEEYADSNYLIFYSENQGVVVWGVKKEDAGKEDPPVYENYYEDEWHLTEGTVSAFLISMAHLQAVMGMEFSSEEYIEISQKQAERIAKRFASKEADSGLYTGVKFYGDHDDTVIVVMNNNDNFILMYSSSDEEHFDEVDELINDII